MALRSNNDVVTSFFGEKKSFSNKTYSDFPTKTLGCDLTRIKWFYFSIIKEIPVKIRRVTLHQLVSQLLKLTCNCLHGIYSP